METPPNILSVVLSLIYYVVVGVLTLLSAFAVYILLRYGKNRLLSLVVSVCYCLFYLQILAQSFRTYQSLV